MTTRIHKPRKRPPKSEPADPRPMQRLKLIDEFITLDKEVDEFKVKSFRHQKLRELILGWYPQLQAEEEAMIPGTNWDILISSRDKLRSVTLEGKQKLFKKWGAREFIAKAAVLLKSLPDPKDELGLYTQQTLTGPRHLHVVAKGERTAAANPAA